MTAAAVITIIATFLGGIAPIVGAPVFAIVIGIVVALIMPLPGGTRPGLSFTSRQILQGSIIVLGFELSLRQVLETGADSMPVLLGTLVIGLVMAFLIGRALGLGRDLNTLIGVGTAICGASAIAATDAVIDAEESDVSYAIATIFVFNVIAVLTFPSLGHLMGMSQQSFGLWAGTAINDTSSVVAASNIYGSVATSYAVIVKLTRTLSIIPIVIGLALWQNRSQTPESALDTGQTDTNQTDTETPTPDNSAPRPSLIKVFPTFILWFIAAVILNSLGGIPHSWHHGLANIATWMITAALAAIGLSTKFGDIREAGPRPILLGAMLWIIIATSSLGLQVATGTL